VAPAVAVPPTQAVTNSVELYGMVADKETEAAEQNKSAHKETAVSSLFCSSHRHSNGSGRSLLGQEANCRATTARLHREVLLAERTSLGWRTRTQVTSLGSYLSAWCDML